jgi:hypothetical protein
MQQFELFFSLICACPLEAVTILDRQSQAALEQYVRQLN